MGDRCYLQFDIAKKDYAKVVEVLANLDPGNTDSMSEIGTQDEGRITIEVVEANYGWHDELKALAEAGLTFSGSHGSGGNYGGMHFACWKGQYAECDGSETGLIMCPVVLDGENNPRIDEAAFENIKEYCRLDSLAEAYISGLIAEG